MTQPVNIDYTTIDFDALKSELISYLKDTGSFKDIDYVSSNIRTLVELYAYLGSLFGFYINSIANEPFLPSAKRYKSLNRIAKMLAYNPRGDRSATLDVIGSLDPEYSLGKEGKYFEIPSYSSFPSTKATPDGTNFSFTNTNNIVYMVKSFGVRTVQASDFSYGGFSLPFTASVSGWTVSSSGVNEVTFDASKLTLDVSDTKPLSVLDRVNPTNYKGYDSVNAPLFNPNSNSSVGQPFIRSLTTLASTVRFKPNTNYFVLFTYDTQQSKPFLEILEDGSILSDRRDDVISVIRLTPDDASGTYYTLEEVQSNAAGRFYVGVLGMLNLDSTQFAFDKIESQTNAVKQIHLDINKSGDKPAFQVLVDGTVYSFTSGRLSSQIFDLNSWDANQPSYNVNLTIVSPDAPDYNYDAKLNVTSKDPGVGEVTIAKIYPTVVDSETGIATLKKDVGQRFGNIQAVPQIDIITTEQKTGNVTFAQGISSIYVPFDVGFVKSTPSEIIEYIVNLTPSENVQVWFSDKSEAGFTINVDSNADFDGSVSWIATRLKKEDSRTISVTFDEPIPQIDGVDADYTIFLTPSDNIHVWYENKTSKGFDVRVERSFQGTVSYSTFVFSSNSNVLAESSSSTQKRGSITLSGTTLTRDITFDSEFADNQYGLHMVANKNVAVWYTNKTSTGFTINVESTDGNVMIDWFADYSTAYIYQKHGMLDFSGQVTSAGTIPGLRYVNIPETFTINGLKQGTISFSYINHNGVIESANNKLGLIFSADRRSADEIKFQFGRSDISDTDVRIFVKSDSSDWEEWSNASLLSASVDIKVGEKIFFCRMDETKKLEVWFGDGVTFGADPVGKEIMVFGLITVGKDGNIPPNALSQSVILSRSILGDDNVTIPFESQFVELLGLKTTSYFAADGATDPTVIYDSEGTTITTDVLKIRQNNPANGGAFAETVEELRSSASSANLRQDRVVSLDDYKTFCQTTFSDIISQAEVLSYREIQNTGFIPVDQNAKYFFNYIFLVVLPKVGNGLTKLQKDYMLSVLNQHFKAMATVEHEIFSATNVPIDVLVRYKPTKFGNVASIQTGIQKVIRDYFDSSRQTLGAELQYSDIITQITTTVSNIDFIEMAMYRDDGNKLTASDYNISAVTGINETVAEVKRKKILELLAKDESLLMIVEPLLAVTDSNTGKKEWVFSQNITLGKYEFPILGQIVIEGQQ